MTVTHLIRHGRTPMSAAHLVNGVPGRRTILDLTGEEQCRQLAEVPWLDGIATCITSQFARAQQTADIVLGTRTPHRVVEPRLDEIDYGDFEGGSWLIYGAWLDKHGRHARPPGAAWLN
ncbi:histidine phosphatase family protein [Actinokineospora sp.]|uniref:histidine phosphatase family protein n=1 Tax=Actinokineospora sp. TaxID=1872133 RepID=UPI004037F25F